MARPMICVSVPASTTTAAIETINTIEEPDLVEVRLDYATEGLDLRALRGATDAPMIATSRLRGHGGLWLGAEEERRELLLAAAGEEFDYVDVEIDSPSLSRIADEVHGDGVELIVSRHHLDRAPSLGEMLSTHAEARRAGADVVKVVGYASSPGDNLACLEYLAAEPGNLCFNMGPVGVPSRVLSPLMGGRWTYASATEEGRVAPGQPTVGSLREVYRLMGVPL